MDAKVSKAEFGAFKRDVQESMYQLESSIQAGVEKSRVETEEKTARLENSLHDVISMVHEMRQVMEPDELSDGTEVYGEDELSHTDTDELSSSSSDSGDSESDTEEYRRPINPYNEPQPGPYEYPY
jgi:hypothetical protein